MSRERRPLAPTTIDANVLAAGVSELLQRTLGESVAPETVLAAGPWRTYIGARQLENAIFSLALNARDAMPGGVNGRQLAEEAVRRRPGPKVLFTTGYTRDAIVHRGRLDPGIDFIGKPHSFAELSAKVRLVLDRSAEPR